VSVFVKAKFFCSAILISPEDVLTAAHCVTDMDEKKKCLKPFLAKDFEVYTNHYNLVSN